MANTEVERQKNTLISPFLIYFFQTLICIGFNSKIASQIHIIRKEIQKYLLKIWTNLDNKYKEFVIRNTRSENCLKWAKSPCFPAQRANAIWRTVSWQQHGGWSGKRFFKIFNILWSDQVHDHVQVGREVFPDLIMVPHLFEVSCWWCCAFRCWAQWRRSSG